MNNKIRHLFHISLVLLASIPVSCVGAVESKQSANSAYNDHGSNDAILRQVAKGFSGIAKEATPAVVYIECQPTAKEQTPQRRSKKGPYENPFDYFNDEFFNRFFGMPEKEDESKKSTTVRGSGFIISSDGYIVTNYHVVENCSKVNVTLHNGRKVVASIVGTDPRTDLAVIKIEEKNLPFLTFGDSDTLEVGEWAIAIGNPFGLQATVTVGVVSAKGRNQLNITDFEDFIQTDAAINPGNSGGPLLNIDGKVIGINTAIVSGSGGYMGIGFAIPSSMAIRIKDQLIKNGSVVRGFLGVTLQPIDSDLATFYKLDKVQGAIVSDVTKNSPAEVAGLKQEDIILSYNNIPIESLSSFRNAVSLMSPGTKLHLTVLRDGKVIDVNMTIGAVPEELGGANAPAQKLGIQVQPLTPDVAQQYGFTNEKGVVITSVKPGSLAAEAMLRPGVIIVSINRQKISNLDEFNSALQDAFNEGKLLLMVRQGDVFRFVTIPLA